MSLRTFLMSFSPISCPCPGPRFLISDPPPGKKFEKVGTREPATRQPGGSQGPGRSQPGASQGPGRSQPRGSLLVGLGAPLVSRCLRRPLPQGWGAVIARRVPTLRWATPKAMQQPRTQNPETARQSGEARDHILSVWVRAVKVRTSKTRIQYGSRIAPKASVPPVPSRLSIFEGRPEGRIPPAPSSLQ